MKQSSIFFRSLRCDLKRAICLKSFLAAVTIILIINAVSVLNEISLSMWQPQSTAVYYFDTLVLDGTFKFVAFTASVFPSCSLFIGDVKNRSLVNFLARESKGVYIASKVITAALSALATALLAQTITFLVLASVFPVGAEAVYGVSSFAEYIMGSIIINEYICAYWAMFALMVSSFLPNIFVAVASPLLFYYLFNNTIGVKLPYFLRIGTAGFYSNIAVDTFYVVAYYTALCVVLGIVFSKRVRRLLRNGSII